MVRPGKWGGGAGLRKNSPIPWPANPQKLLKHRTVFQQVEKEGNKKHVSWIAACTWDNYVWIWESKKPILAELPCKMEKEN